MIRNVHRAVTLIAGFLLLGSSGLQAADSFEQSGERRHGHSAPRIGFWSCRLWSLRWRKLSCWASPAVE